MKLYYIIQQYLHNASIFLKIIHFFCKCVLNIEAKKGYACKKFSQKAWKNAILDAKSIKSAFGGVNWQASSEERRYPPCFEILKQNWGVTTSQIVFFYFSVESSFADAEDFCGLFAVAFCFSQRVYNGLLFQLI